jgi:outer membrane protease
MSTKISLSRQIDAARVAHSMLTGSAKPSAKEKAYIAPHMEAVVQTLEWLRDNEEAIKQAIVKKEIP